MLGKYTEEGEGPRENDMGLFLGTIFSIFKQ